MKNVEWGEFKLSDLFEIVSTKSLDSNAIDFTKTGINFVGRTFENNGIQGKIQKRNFEPNKPFTITATVIGNYKYVKYQTEPYYCSQNINKLTPKSIIKKWNEKIAYYLMASLQKFVSLYDGQQGGYKLEDIKKHKIYLPTKNGKIDFEFMESFIAELEAERIAELEAYLLATGLKDYTLTAEEQQALEDVENLQWESFNLEKLFGKSTRGKRLKSEDRIAGLLPFVTAGETDEGISAFIGNDVTVFSENTTTIDMFGSAKYRNYKYGGDDHIAVVHTEDLPKFAAIFVTTAIHKSSYTGKFHYGRNFYAKDADELNISLPTENQQPNYAIMETFISAIQKLVIKEVVLYSDRKIAATKTVVNK
ncbi:MAG TPA: restriction endonuclease [Flavobacterium sp.]|nr:restriction endonuclease [Flavobacterium sp.]